MATKQNAPETPETSTEEVQMIVSDETYAKITALQRQITNDKARKSDIHDQLAAMQREVNQVQEYMEGLMKQIGETNAQLEMSVQEIMEQYSIAQGQGFSISETSPHVITMQENP